MANNSGRVPALDGVRGVAISLVVFWHFFQTPMGDLSNHPYAAKIFAMGRLTWSGVDLFFVLSGFLIGGILLDAAGADNFFSVFYIRRFHRIIPLCAIVLLGLSIVPLILTNLGVSCLPQNRIPWFLYATFTQNFWMARAHLYGSTTLGVTWSLAVEEQFYLTLPLVIRYVSRARLWWIVGGMILGALLLRLVLSYALADATMANYVLMPCRADALGLGLGIALVKRTPDLWRRVLEHRRWVHVALGVFSCGVLALLLSKFTPFTGQLRGLEYSLLGFFYASLLLTVLVDARFESAFSVASLRYLGITAYGLYLLHPIVLSAIRALAGPGPTSHSGWWTLAVSCCALIASVAAATFSWKALERPLVQRGHRYGYRFPDVGVQAQNPVGELAPAEMLTRGVVTTI